MLNSYEIKSELKAQLKSGALTQTQYQLKLENLKQKELEANEKRDFLLEQASKFTRKGNAQYAIVRFIEDGDCCACFKVGTGRNSSTQDCREEIAYALTQMGHQFNLTNDAPRGGLLGWNFKTK